MTKNLPTKYWNGTVIIKEDCMGNRLYGGVEGCPDYLLPIFRLWWWIAFSEMQERVMKESNEMFLEMLKSYGDNRTQRHEA